MMFTIPIKISNLNGGPGQELELKVDTGSHFSMIKTSDLGNLNLSIVKNKLTREPEHITIGFADSNIVRSLKYGPVELLIPVHLSDGTLEWRTVHTDVIEGNRNILGMTQLEQASADVDVTNQRLIGVIAEM